MHRDLAPGGQLNEAVIYKTKQGHLIHVLMPDVQVAPARPYHPRDGTRPCWVEKRVIRLGVKEVLTCVPKAAADPGFDESA